MTHVIFWPNCPGTTFAWEKNPQFRPHQRPISPHNGAIAVASLILVFHYYLSFFSVFCVLHFTISMGIPMWREPAKAEANKTTLEKDPTAAARSSIGRRGRAYRSRRSGLLSSFHSQIIDELRGGGSGNQTSVDRFPVRSPILANGTSEDGMTLEESRREAWTRAPPPRQRRSESSNRESSNRQNRSTRDTLLNNLLASYAPPSGTSGSGSSNPPAYTSTQAYWGLPSSNNSDSPSYGVRLPPLRRTDSYGTELARFLQANMPPEVRDSPANSDGPTWGRLRLDGTTGLGDRQRSPSPDGERETDAWETLLSTITPDATLPSTDSSFASNSASAPASDTRRLIFPVPPPGISRNGTLEPYPDNLNPCDFSSSDDEDAPSNPRYTRLRGNSARERERERERERRRRDRNSTLSAHPPLPNIAHTISDHYRQSDEIQQMQVILDRLASREDVPDNWWAAVGVTPTLNRGLSDSLDSTDNEGPSRPPQDM
ncbi:unnamed protein product [Penicillium salamii]|nr:unnamed protein product [Penicillium salamii]CAG8163479.1 unnamed protein product [Penicillium salamii]CAG8429472.1 unnamed protein product [Penicillium salamii]